MEYRTAVPINTITIKVKDVEMPIKSAMAAAMVDAEEPAEIQIEPTAAKMKIKFTILPNHPFTAFSPREYLHKAPKRSSLSFLM